MCVCTRRGCAVCVCVHTFKEKKQDRHEYILKKYDFLNETYSLNLERNKRKRARLIYSCNFYIVDI